MSLGEMGHLKIYQCIIFKINIITVLRLTQCYENKMQFQKIFNG